VKHSSTHLSKLTLRLLVIAGMAGFPVVGSALPAHAAATVEIVDGGDGYLNATEIAAGVVARGTADPGAEVRVTFDDEDSTTPAVEESVTADASGAWQTPAENLAALKDGTVTASASDNQTVHVEPVVEVVLPGGSTATATTIKDTVAPTIILTVDGAEDGSLNAADVAAGVVVHGKTEPGVTGSLVVNKLGADVPNVVRSFVAGADGSFATDALDLSPIADGTLRFGVGMTDRAGNPGSAFLDVLKDTSGPAAPAVLIVDPDLSGSLTQSEIHDVTVKVTSVPANAGLEVHLVVDDADAQTLTHVVDGTLDVLGLLTAQHLELSNLKDGPITATATITDADGNASPPGTGTILKAAGAPPLPPGVEILDNPGRHPADDPGAMTDGFIDEYTNIDETAGGTAFRVRVDIAPSEVQTEVFIARVTVDDEDPATPAVTSAAKAIAGSSPVDTRTFAVDVRSLKDGGVTATAELRKDLGGGGYSLSSFSDVTVLDLHAPTTTLGTVPTVLPQFFGATVEGSSQDLPPISPIQLVAVTFTDDSGWYETHTATLDKTPSTDTGWSVDVSLNPGTYTVYAQAQDEAGNFEARGANNTVVIDVL
jgi:hypothetical protein